MNDPRKALNVNSSSLLSLKAELIRKKNEVILAKEEQSNAAEFGPRPTSKKMTLKEPVDNEKDDNRAKDGEVFETEDSLLLEKSRRVLEAKSRFYDQMTRSGGGLNIDDNCLVLFNRKHQEQDGAGPSQKESTVMRSSSESDDDGKDEKVEKAKVTVMLKDVDMEEKKKSKKEAKVTVKEVDMKEEKKTKKEATVTVKDVDMEEKKPKMKKEATVTVKDVDMEEKKPKTKKEATVTVKDVDMEEKKTNKEEKQKGSSDSDKEEEYDDDWVEYTDCLGRTRKCLRKDLAECLRRDKDLQNGVSSKTNKPYWMIDNETDSQNRKIINMTNVIAPRLLQKEKRTLSNVTMADTMAPNNSKPRTKLEEQRAAWEIKEQENLEKLDLHYQDVFFNEARLHGVSYFEFSTDPAERKKQQKELMDARRETLKQQSNFQHIKDKREKLMKNRLFLARNRSRQREGLKPFTWREFEDDYNKNKLAPIEIKVVDPAEELRKWKERREKTRIEVLQELDRRARIRPWDMGKKDENGNEFNVGLANIDGGWRYKGERLPMSQEEWNEKMRAERKPEFAPMPEPKSKSSIKPKRTNFTCIPSLTSKPITGDFIPLQTTKPEFKKRSYEGAANEENGVEQDEEASKPSNSSESSSSSDSDSNSDSDSSSSDSSDSDSDTNSDSDSDSGSDSKSNSNSGSGSDIEPDHGKRSKQNGHAVNLETSIDAGLKFLREQSDKGKSTKASWTSNADY